MSTTNNDGFEMPARDEEAEMAAAKKAMAGFGKAPAKVVRECDRLAGPYAFGPFVSPSKEEESRIVWRQFVGAGGAVA